VNEGWFDSHLPSDLDTQEQIITLAIASKNLDIRA